MASTPLQRIETRARQHESARPQIQNSGLNAEVEKQRHDAEVIRRSRQWEATGTFFGVVGGLAGLAIVRAALAAEGIPGYPSARDLSSGKK